MSNGMAGSKSSSESHIIGSFIELRQRAQSAGPKRVAVIVADDEIALTAAEGALNLGIAHPVLIGNERNIRDKAQLLKLKQLLAEAKVVAAKDPARTAVQMAHDGNVDVLLKGHLRTDELLSTVLHKENGLRQDVCSATCLFTKTFCRASADWLALPTVG